MKIVNIKGFQMALFVVGDALHITVSNMQKYRDTNKPIDRDKLSRTDVAIIIANHFSDTFHKTVSTVCFKNACNLFHHSFKTLILIVK